MLISMEHNMRDYQMEKEAREKRILAYLRNAVLVLRKRVMPMNTMEVLTLLLVIFTALSFIDNHKKK